MREVQSGDLFNDLYEDGSARKGSRCDDKIYGKHKIHDGPAIPGSGRRKRKKKSGRFKILLSPEFCEFCGQHAVPIDYEVYKDIDSPIGKDLYTWLVFRNNGLKDETYIPRNRLVDQFIPVEEGKDPNLVNVNYARIVELLKDIKENYYPEVRIKFSEYGDGITLYKSPTPVLKSDPRYALITTDI